MRRADRRSGPPAQRIDQIVQHRLVVLVWVAEALAGVDAHHLHPCLLYGSLHCRKLLHDFPAVAPFVDHPLHAAHLSLNAPQLLAQPLPLLRRLDPYLPTPSVRGTHYPLLIASAAPPALHG